MVTTSTELGLPRGEISEDWNVRCRFFENSKVVNPIGLGYNPPGYRFKTLLGRTSKGRG